MADSSDPASQQPETTQEDVDVSIEADVNANTATQPDAMNLDGANDSSQADPLGVVHEAVEPRIAAKKDATLREFMNKMDEYAPIVCILFHHGKDLYLPQFCPQRVLISYPIDTRCSNKLLHDPRRPPSTTPNLPPSVPPSSPRDAEIHRRHCGRCVPIRPHPLLEHELQ